MLMSSGCCPQSSRKLGPCPVPALRETLDTRSSLMAAKSFKRRAGDRPSSQGHVFH